MEFMSNWSLNPMTMKSMLIGLLDKSNVEHVVISSGSSVYISSCGFTIRISNHPSHAKCKCLQLRSDVHTQTKKNIWNIKDVSKLIAYIKKENF